jgi:hypothetical protein
MAAGSGGSSTTVLIYNRAMTRTPLLATLALIALAAAPEARARTIYRCAMVP